MPDAGPDEIAEVLRAFGLSRVRVGIISATVAAGSVTAQDLMAALQVGRATLVPHTRALVEAGILVEETDPTMVGAGSGFNRLVWRVDAGALGRHLELLQQILRSAP